METNPKKTCCARCGNELERGGGGRPRPWQRLCDPCMDRREEKADVCVADYLTAEELAEMGPYEGEGHPEEGSE